RSPRPSGPFRSASNSRLLLYPFLAICLLHLQDDPGIAHLGPVRVHLPDRGLALDLEVSRDVRDPDDVVRADAGPRRRVDVPRGDARGPVALLGRRGGRRVDPVDPDRARDEAGDVVARFVPSAGLLVGADLNRRRELPDHRIPPMNALPARRVETLPRPTRSLRSSSVT